jgi:hypothetical protein
MNYHDAVAEIKKYFAEQWDNLTGVAYDDFPFTTPDNTPWVRLNIRHEDGYQASVGSPQSNKFRRDGLVTVQIFTPKGQAQITALQTADAVVNIFEAKPRISGIMFNNVRVNEIGDDGFGWYQINVKADFSYDTIA